MVFQQRDKEALKEHLKQIFKEEYGKLFVGLNFKQRDIVLEK